MHKPSSIRAVTAVMVGSMLATSPLLVTAAAAQEAAPSEKTKAVPTGSVCLANAVGLGERKGQPILVAVPSNQAEKFRERGFQDAPCARVKVRDKSGVCALAEVNDPALNAYFWEMFSYTAEESCKVIETAEAQ
jgi:hypothetical protein